jgi:hypothetical protein
VAASVAGRQRECSSYFLNPPADPIFPANKVNCEQCRRCSPRATICAAVVTAVLPLAAMLSLAFVVLPCRPSLASSPSCCLPPCRPLPLSSCRAAPCCVAQCYHHTTLHQRDPPPCAAFCAAIMLTVPPLIDATLLPLKDKIWVWQNEFYLQIKYSFVYYNTLPKFTNLYVFKKVNCHKTIFVFCLKKAALSSFYSHCNFPHQLFLPFICN